MSKRTTFAYDPFWFDKDKEMAIRAKRMPIEHAAVIVQVCNGNLLEAWMIALDNRFFNRRDTPQCAYWHEVAEAIAKIPRIRPNSDHADPHFYRPQRRIA